MKERLQCVPHYVHSPSVTLFKIGDAEYSWNVGFTDAEINSLGPRSLQMVVTTMIGEHSHCCRV